MILTVSSAKGGTGKTTSAAYLGHALAERGRSVVLFDADPQESLMRWAEFARPGWLLTTEAWPKHPDEAAARVRTVADAGFDVVIDTPPTDAGRDRVSEALAVSTHVLVPVAPTAAEYERTPYMRELIERAERKAGARITASVLIVRSVAGASSTRIYRELLTEDGWRVLRPTVGRLEMFAQAFGVEVRRATSTAYGDVLAELAEVDDEAREVLA